MRRGGGGPFRVIPLRGTGPVRIDVRSAGARPEGLRWRVDELWREMCARNPRLYDGPLLAVTGFDGARNRVECARSTFRWLAVRQSVETGTTILSVTGVLTGRDGSGEPHVLLARRSAQTRIYHGMWEFAPSGGVPPPREGAERVEVGEVLEALASEGEEELGVDLRAHLGEAAIPALTVDELAHSVDLVVRVDLPRPIEPRRGVCAGERWEYSDAAWVRLRDVPGFVREHGEAIIGPTVALLRHFGWAGGGRAEAGDG